MTKQLLMIPLLTTTHEEVDIPSTSSEDFSDSDKGSPGRPSQAEVKKAPAAAEQVDNGRQNQGVTVKHTITVVPPEQRLNPNPA